MPLASPVPEHHLKKTQLKEEKLYLDYLMGGPA
jgi:hypothetical protein